MVALLSELAPEIIIQIFKSAQHPRVATSLSETSLKFNAIWKENAGPICSSILPRIIPHFSKAQELVNTQRARNGSDAPGQDKYVLATQRAQALLRNQRLAYLLMDSTEKALNAQGTSLSSSEYVPVYYQAISLFNMTTFRT